MIVGKVEFQKSKKKYMRELKKQIFIYPTDTIYGLGCDATNEKLVARIRELKSSSLQPFSIIAPSKQWVYDNCKVNSKEKEYVEQLGKYINIGNQDHRFTLILTLKNKKALAKNVNLGKETIGVRIPNNWFSDVATGMDVPIVTTSANKTGSDFMTSIDNLNKQIKNGVDLIIYEGEKKGKPSTIINLEHSTTLVTPR